MCHISETIHPENMWPDNLLYWHDVWLINFRLPNTGDTIEPDLWLALMK